MDTPPFNDQIKHAFTQLHILCGKVLWAGKDGVDITVGELFGALCLVVLGGWLSKILSVRITKHLPSKIRHSPQGHNVIPRTIYFSLWMIFILMALRVLGIPLTVFNFLGGAMALGFGFGAQNLCSNLISGGILKIARPYKEGDIVESDGQTGQVIAVGIRSTEILTYDGVNLLVPNSNMLSNTIINRTNYDRELRGTVSVGISYKADSRDVEKRLCELAKRQPAVIQEPGKTPWVLFEDFGSSSLAFKLFFWVDTTRGSVAATASEIRHGILKEFRENGISIPYPQLDIHSDTLKNT